MDTPEYLRAIAAALELPPEVVDSPDALIGHAKATTDALIGTHLELEQLRRAARALIERAKDEGWYHYRGTDHERQGFLDLQAALPTAVIVTQEEAK